MRYFIHTQWKLLVREICMLQNGVWNSQTNPILTFVSALCPLFSGNGVCEDGETDWWDYCIADCGTSETMVTTFASDNEQNGNFFNVDVTKEVVLTGVEINVDSETPVGSSVAVQVYHHAGSFYDVMANPPAWDLIVSTAVTSNPEGVGTPLVFPYPLVLPRGIHSLYITRSDSGWVAYKKGMGEGGVVKEDAYIKILEGKGVKYPFGETFDRRIWNGRLNYKVSPITCGLTGVSCSDGSTCCSESCSGGQPSSRVCLAPPGSTPSPTTGHPTVSLAPTESGGGVGQCIPTGEKCGNSPENCCGACETGGNPNNRKCIEQTASPGPTPSPTTGHPTTSIAPTESGGGAGQCIPTGNLCGDSPGNCCGACETSGNPNYRKCIESSS